MINKVIISLILYIGIVSCRKSAVDPVSLPAQGEKVLKQIVIVDLQNPDTINITLNRQQDGMVKSVETIRLSDSRTLGGNPVADLQTVGYQGNYIKEISSSGFSGTLAGGHLQAYSVREEFDYFPDNKLKSYFRKTRRGASPDESYEFVEFQYDVNAGNLSYIVLTTSIDTNRFPVITDTLVYQTPQNAGESYSFSKLNSSPSAPCTIYKSYKFFIDTKFAYYEEFNCQLNITVQGVFSSLRNSLEKPVWNALLNLVPDLNPIPSVNYVPFYFPTLVPDKFLTENTGFYTTTNYEYLTDDRGDILTITETVAGINTKLITFLYESN